MTWRYTSSLEGHQAAEEALVRQGRAPGASEAGCALVVVVGGLEKAVILASAAHFQVKKKKKKSCIMLKIAGLIRLVFDVVGD